MSLPTITVESMLLGWRESHNGGAQITLLLGAEDLEPFKRMTIKKGKVAGQRLMAVFVEIGDDEKPVAQEAPAPKPEPKEPLGPLAQWAVMRCKEREFQLWICKEFLEQSGRVLLDPLCRNEEEHAKLILCVVCGIKSRRELDTNEEASFLFHERIRKPYAAAHVEG